MLFNTTTIPTHIIPTNSFMDVMMVLSMGLVFVASMVEFGLHRMREHAEDEGLVETDTETELTDSDYVEKYKTEFKALVRRPLSEDELTALGTKYVSETLTVDNEVVVILSYDKKTDAFWYYTDHLKEVSYPILETIARKFAIEHDCKSICVEPTLEAVSDVSTSSDVSDVSTSSDAPPEPTTVFAKFKNYNTGGKGAAPNFGAINTTAALEQTNHFRFRGKLADYHEQQLKKTIMESTLDYASYKKLIDKKED